MLMNAANSLNISTPNMYPVSRPINMIDSRVMIFVSLVGNSHSFQSCSNVRHKEYHHVQCLGYAECLGREPRHGVKH